MWNKIRRGVEKLVAPYGNVSYAQYGEDLVLDALAGHRAAGTFVDVGCCHPVYGSTTYRLYRKGWRGVCVDANSEYGRLFRLFRRHDKFVSACVSDRVEEVSFHFFKQPGLNSISGEHLYDNADDYTLERVEKMTTRTLSSILDEAGFPKDFDVLSVDAEGHDENVLRSLGEYSPKILLVELGGTDAEHFGGGWKGRSDYVEIGRLLSNLFLKRRDVS